MNGGMENYRRVVTQCERKHGVLCETEALENYGWTFRGAVPCTRRVSGSMEKLLLQVPRSRARHLSSVNGSMEKLLLRGWSTHRKSQRSRSATA